MLTRADRRQFLTGAASAAAACLLGVREPLAAEGAPEVSTIRLAKIPGLCLAPQYAVDELLRVEGFDDVQYVPVQPGPGIAEAVASGAVDFSMNFAAPLVVALDAGSPIRVVAGIHPGCFELFVNESIHSLLDLRGKSVGVQGIGSTPHVFLAAMSTYVGLDPIEDINWVTSESQRPKELFIEGEIDAFLGFAPEPQELRARGIGRVILNSALDRPWSQYFCCLLSGNAGFIERHPVASKRVARAMLKATDVCAVEPRRIAQRLVDLKFTAQYEYALQTLTELPYASWRDFSAEDTLRFYALRLHEAGMIQSSPNELIAEGTDWRFVNELKRELKV